MPEKTGEVTIYHNPKCGTSRSVLAIIREAGIEPRIIEYLQHPPTRAALAELLQRMGFTPRQLLRDKEPLCAELGLMASNVSDDQITDAMLAHPVLINRPIVVTSKGVRLCRPADAVRTLL